MASLESEMYHLKKCHLSVIGWSASTSQLMTNLGSLRIRLRAPRSACERTSPVRRPKPTTSVRPSRKSVQRRAVLRPVRRGINLPNNLAAWTSISHKLHNGEEVDEKTAAPEPRPRLALIWRQSNATVASDSGAFPAELLGHLKARVWLQKTHANGSETGLAGRFGIPSVQLRESADGIC